jgi:hypothetical protein
MWLAGAAGGIAGFITSPLELISIRTVLDTQIKKDWRRNYVSIIDTLGALKA